MKKQKKGFINFICSLIPGAGEMNMGFEKQGLSIMIVFWGIISVAVLLRMGWILVTLPIIWFYSFFHTHNLKNMSEEAFEAEEDRYLFNLGYIMANRIELFEKYRVLIAGGLIVIGLSVLGREISHVLWNIIPMYLYDTVSRMIQLVFSGILGAAIITAGVLLLRKKEKEIEE